ncbi:ATP-binding protein [Fusibacter bizertensis]|uniref:histidine kinase n=1 Tax=Fusibacter bizertensis TaxID=1488331 RepID=A0ABT6NGJ3_9FIRM|nr:HAMP domain-containing sensor histidine kinase [Fusibacter bizertensis]MDH8679517.1 ATP-binding protein [Fusibacter bizertensis]
MKSIRGKLWTWLMLLVISMLVILWLFQVVFLERFYYAMHFQRTEDKVYEVSKLIGATGSSQAGLNDDGVRTKIEELTELTGLGVMILDGQGSTLYQDNLAVEQMFKRSLSELVSHVLTGKTEITTVAHMRFDTEYWVMATPVIDQKSIVVGAMIITAPIEPVAETAEIIKSQLLYIMLILLILASAIALVVSKQFTRPLIKISLAAKEIAKGKFDTKCEVAQDDEIGQLAKDIEEMGKELGQIDELRKDLIGNISHELRTPLSIIKGYAETLRDVTGNNQEKRELQLDIIIKESNRLSSLIDDVLNMSQLQSGQSITQESCFDMLPLLEEMKARFNVMHPVEIICDVHRTLVFADRDKIEQVLINLIGNAINHAQTETAIRIRVLEAMQCLRVEVSDDGKGIPEKSRLHIWDRFYQLEDQNKGKPMGSGLGLAITKALLLAHDANFGVESELGVGTTFWFELKTCSSNQ